jgi:hypothetical protein
MSLSARVIITTLFIASCSYANAQDIHTAYGSTARARRSSHHTDKDLRVSRAHLGYIDVDHASLQEFMDNLEVGLTATGSPNLKLVSYKILIQPKLQDIRESDKIMGDKIPRRIFDQLHMADLKSGDVVTFENIFIEQDDHAVRRMADVRIKIE